MKMMVALNQDQRQQPARFSRHNGLGETGWAWPNSAFSWLIVNVG